MSERVTTAAKDGILILQLPCATGGKSVPARRNSIVVAFICVILAALLLPLIVLAQTGVSATTSTTLNLRAGPGRAYAAIGTLPGGVTVPVEGRSADNQWALVKAPAGRGWIAAWLVQMNGSFASVPLSTEVITTTTVTVRTPAPVRMRMGPGTTYELMVTIPVNTMVTAVARNSERTWLLVDYAGMRGWVAAWLVVASSDISRLPISTSPGGSTPNTTPLPGTTSTPMTLTPYPTAVLPPPFGGEQYTGKLYFIDGAAAAIYERGQAFGNNPKAFAKVGASDSAKVEYLRRFDDNYYDLEDYAYLEEVLVYFKGSFNYVGQALMEGMPIEAMLDPTWANPDYCDDGETPIECDYRRQKPSIVLLQLLTGTQESGPYTKYYDDVRTIVDFYVARGVIPVLMTSPRRGYPNAPSEPMNDSLRLIAMQYKIPLWDFYVTTDTLPNYGLGEDNNHVSIPADGRTTFFYPEYMNYGMVRRNLESLEVLHAILNTAMGK
jgi:uncharacterized protein YraI